MQILKIIMLLAVCMPIQAIFLGSICSPVYIALKQNNIDVLSKMLQTISNPMSDNYGKWLTHQEVHAIIDPNKEQQNKVLEWIYKHPVKNIVNNGDSITFCSQKASLVGMFNIPIVFSDSKLLLKNYTVPEHLRDVIDFVEMYSVDRGFGVKQRPLVTMNDTVDDRYIGLEPLKKLYNLPSRQQEMTIKTAAIEFQGNEGYTNTDINKQRTLNGMTDSGVTKNIGNNIGIDIESELDVQMLSMVNGNNELWYWSNPYWLYSFAVEYDKTFDKPDIISISWGWAEKHQCDIIDCVNITSESYVSRTNNEFLKMAIQGTTIVVSSGDAGAPGRTNEECSYTSPINPVFPGSSPYVLSIGATYVVKESTVQNFTTPLCTNNACVAGSQEAAISYDKTGWTAGGGFDSYHNETQWWQKSAVNDYLNSGVELPPDKNYNKNGRAYPDVAAVGHSCPTVVNGGLVSVDGTSCSAPIVGGLLTYIWEQVWNLYRVKAGFINPLLYYIYENCKNCVNDISVGYNWCTEGACCSNGTNFGFSSYSGYDPVTGIGTLNINNILTFLNDSKNTDKILK